MAIPSVMQGLIEVEGGRVFELDSSKGLVWLESVTSFRYEPTTANKPYTVRKESGKGGDYWYGYRKVSGKLHKKYVGKTSEVNTAKLEEIAEALNVVPEPRLQKAAQAVTDSVTQQVTDIVTRAEFLAMQSEVQALRESLEALRSELPGKSDAGNSPELPIVTDGELQTKLGNLRFEIASPDEIESALVTPDEAKKHAAIYGFNPDEALADAYFQLNMLTSNFDELEGRHEALKRQLATANEENAELRHQLENVDRPGELYQKIEQLQEKNRLLTVKSREERQKLEDELKNLRYSFESAGRRLAEKQKRLDELESEENEVQQPATATSLPEAATVLNRFKSKRKKSNLTLPDMELILEIIEEFCTSASASASH